MFFFFNDTATTEIYTLSLHDALPICPAVRASRGGIRRRAPALSGWPTMSPSIRVGSTAPRWTARSSGHRRAIRSEEHTSELQSRQYLVCRLLFEKKKINIQTHVAI